MSPPALDCYQGLLSVEGQKERFALGPRMRVVRVSARVVIAVVVALAGSSTPVSAAISPVVGHCVNVNPIYAAGHRVTDAYQICAPVGSDAH